MISTSNFFRKLSFLLILISGLFSCKISMNAGDAGNAKTISIAFFPNNASLVQPTLSQAFTEDLRNFFQSQSRLSLIPRSGDLQIQGSITDYRVTPVGVSNTAAASNRLSISVQVVFTNRLDETKDFEQTFTRFADFPSSQNLSSVETELIKEINSQLSQDIFNKALINW
jgi:hypothetical protein